MKKFKSGIIFIIFFLKAATMLTARETDYPSMHDLIPDSQYYLDKNGNTEINEINELARNGKFKKSSQTPLQFGYTKSAVWLAFSSKNIISGDEISNNHWFLELLNPVTSYIDVYFVENQGKIFHIYSGGLLRFQRKELFQTTYYCNITDFLLKNGTFFIKLKSRYSQVVGARIISDVQYSYEESKNRILPGIITGILMGLFLYNIFLYFSLKDMAYFYYSGYMLFGGIFFSQNVGYFKLFFQANTKLMVNIDNLILTIWGIFHILFVQKFLDLPKMQNRISWLLNAILAAWAGLGVFYYWIPANIYYQCIEFLGMSALILYIIAAVRSYRNRFYPARFFLLGYAAFFIFFAMYLLMMINVIPIDNFSFFLLLPGIGHASEAALLSFALADRYKVLENESISLRELRKDMQLAADVQKRLFPEINQQSNQYRINGNYIPSSQMCGDFYDIIEDSEKNSVSILISDIAGHGYSASLISAMVKVAFHQSYVNTSSASEQLTEMNKILSAFISNTFITAGILKLQLNTMTAEYSQAGHMPLLLNRRGSPSVETFKPAGIPLGISREKKWSDIRFACSSGDRIFMFTDGLIEIINSSGNEFGMDQLNHIIKNNQEMDADHFSESLIQTLKKWDRNKLIHQDDDITFIVIDIL